MHIRLAARLFKRSTLALVEFAVDAQCRDIIVTAFQFGSRSMKPGIPALALLTAGSAFAVSVAAAQTAPKPAAAAPAQALFAVSPYKNLKVFPQDITRAQLLSNMKLFSQSLGVRCTYCHVGTEGQPLSTFDFASDAKEHKVIRVRGLAASPALADRRSRWRRCLEVPSVSHHLLGPRRRLRPSPSSGSNRRSSLLAAAAERIFHV